MTHTTNNI